MLHLGNDFIELSIKFVRSAAASSCNPVLLNSKQLLTLSYDLNGNLTGQEDVTGKVTEYRYDRLVSYEKDGSVSRLAYDDAGNLLRDDRASHTYDAFNHQTKAEMFDWNIQINRYDPEGLWYEMEENGRLVQFIFRDKEVVTEESEVGMVRYIRTHELLASDAERAKTYYHYASDELGSITHVTEGEEVLNRYGY